MSEEEIINKLNAIKVCGDKGELWNYEAGKILSLIKNSYKVKFKVGEKARLRDGLTIGCMGRDHNKEVIIKRIIISANHISYYVDYIKDGEIHNFMVGLEDSDLIEL